MPKSIIAAFLLCLTVSAGEIHLTWSTNKDESVTNYAVWYGPSSYGYTNRIDYGTERNAVLQLPSGNPWFFNLTVQSTNGIESDFTTETQTFAASATNAIVSIAWSANPNGPWINLVSATNLVTNASGFYKTTILITNVP